MKFILDFNNDKKNSILTLAIIVIVILIIISIIALILKKDDTPHLVLASNRITLAVGDMQEIKYELKGLEDVDISYSSKNVGVAVVSNSGIITAVSPGSTYIVMSYSLGNNTSYSNLIFVTVN